MKTFYKLIFVLIAALILSGEVSASPSARYQPAMVYDNARRTIVLFGGMEGSGQHLSDTWEWNGVSWKKLSETGPSARSGHALAYDEIRKKVLLFGGVGKSGAFGDTWEWNGENWTEIKPPESPAPRIAPQMVYDSRRKKIILFGGLDSANKKNFADTWELDGRSWKKASETGPAGRFHHCLAYDRARRKVVLFGGNVAEGVLDFQKYKSNQKNDTWEWDGKSWTQVNVATSPSPRDHHAMTYDAKRKRIVLFGGFDGAYLNDLWEWDGKSWKRIIASNLPPARGGKPGLAFDAESGKTVLFGGGIGGGTAAKPEAFGDTWLWNGIGWEQVSVEKRASIKGRKRVNLK